MALFSQNPDAIPLLCLHGWPGNFLEFYSILEILTQRYTPETLPYHIVVPSLPGYAFSSPPPLTRNFQLQNIASIMNTLMIDLGFGNGYAVQGGDIGSKVSRVMAATFDTVKAIHSKLQAGFASLKYNTNAQCSKLLHHARARGYQGRSD